jgi:alpha-glucosidase (family GH31 glycosyl hydrolase)
MSRIIVYCIIICLILSCISCAVQRRKFTDGNNKYLVVEVLSDTIIHFEYASGEEPSVDKSIYTTPMIHKVEYDGPSKFREQTHSIETNDVALTIQPNTLCVKFYYKTRGYEATTICPYDIEKSTKVLTIDVAGTTSVYGLGEQFWTGGAADGDWVGRVRSTTGHYGNHMNEYYGGAVGNAQFPIMYAVGANYYNYALLLDNIYKQQWKFDSHPYSVSMWGDEVRFYFIAGQDLHSLRSSYLSLVGRPPVPPKKIFGVWTGEYNLYYDSNMMIQKLDDLRKAQFPFDGIMLDVQWFGGVNENSDNSPMGTLQYHPTFLNNRPVSQLQSELQKRGIGVIPIEESYVTRGDKVYEHMAQKCMFARKKQDTCEPIYLSGQNGDNCWWGQGSYIDWTNPAAGAFWHDNKRVPLIQTGNVVGHWTDLGEPEIYRAEAVYNGFEIDGKLKNTHGDIHNSYNLLWHKSIYDGYRRNKIPTRTLMVSRSGTIGIQRYGAAMWSADIGGNFQSLSAHLNAQMHMSFSGIDYYSADIGGFHRKAPANEVPLIYTRWYANAMWLDFPARAHVENLCNCKQVTPDKIGHIESNRFNTIQRYELVPYYYSLAYRAAMFGEPIAPPLSFYYQNDQNTRSVGHQKLIGRDIVIGIVASFQETERNMYLPKGIWINYHTNEWLSSSGQFFEGVPVYQGSVFTLPAFVRAGAIIPKMHVDGHTKNVFGLRDDGAINTDLIVRVYHDISKQQHEFILFEDDGQTIDYETGKFAKTLIAIKDTVVSIAGTSGSYHGIPVKRKVVVEFVTHNRYAANVFFKSVPLRVHKTKAEFDAADSGYFNTGNNLIIAKANNIKSTETKTFVFELASLQPSVSIFFKCLGETTVEEELYITGSGKRLGNWNLEKAIKLDSSNYPVWTSHIRGFTESSHMEWKCAKKHQNGKIVLSSGSNNIINLKVPPTGGYAGVAHGKF